MLCGTTFSKTRHMIMTFSIVINTTLSIKALYVLCRVLFMLIAAIKSIIVTNIHAEC
jgi:hypothetical protein